MRPRILTTCLAAMVLSCLVLNAQSPMNMSLSNPEALPVLTGNYDPTSYEPSNQSLTIDEFVCGLRTGISTDSLEALLINLERFYTRHTYSDTVSNDTGIGAARRWAYDKFLEYRHHSENRLIVSYLDFELNFLGLCGAGHFRNVLGILPGLDTTDPSIIIIEGHMDSRCEGSCDATCLAAGTEDNGSGTALVMELARVMSKLYYDHTIVFMLTVGEEQGLYGAEAFAQYCSDNSISIKAVQNNDVIGGIICGETSSPPSCPFENHIDSTQVRIFSFGNANSPHKMFARTIKMLYGEKMKPISDVPMTISLMIPEDRTGRGGDHIPFRQLGYTAIRFTAANEHGDANTGAPGYTDRQHTSDDILGVDTDGDGRIDSFFVDMNYLKRNTEINGLTATMLAIGPETPLFTSTSTGSGIVIDINDPNQYRNYRVGVRDATTNPDFLAVYTVRDTNQFTVPNLSDGATYRISLAVVDQRGVMGMFLQEASMTSQANTFGLPYDTVEYTPCQCPAVGIRDVVPNPGNEKTIRLLQNVPNPFVVRTIIPIIASTTIDGGTCELVVHDMIGRERYRAEVHLTKGYNSVQTDLKNLSRGVYYYSIRKDGKMVDSRKMIVE